MYCPNCGKELQEGAKFCLECGAKIGVSDTTASQSSSETEKPVYTGNAPSEKSSAQSALDSDTVIVNNSTSNIQNNPVAVPPKRKKGKKVLLILLLILIPLIIYGVFSDSGDGESDSSNKSSFFVSDEISDETYISCAKQVVAEQLRSPGSAIFSNCEVMEKDDYGRVLVVGYVDSQNGFGATLRNGFAVVITNYDKETERFSYSRSFELWKWEFDYLKDTTIENVKSNSQWNEPKETEATT